MNAANSLYKKLDKATVVHVYSGKANRCMCGCAGKHSYATRSVAEQSKRHGYEVHGSDRSVALIVGKINNAPAHAEVKYDGEYVCATYGDRTYVAYFR